MTGKVAVAIGMALGATVLAGSARADDRSGVLEGRHHHYESPQHWAMEFRFGPYRPRVDEDPALRGTPYADAFGTNARVLAAFELDWQVLRIPHVGTIGPGAGVGYTTMGAKAKLSSDHSKDSGEDTSLDIFPFYGVAVLRADVLMRDFRIPVVPYAKGGVGFAFWRASNSLGTSVANGVTGKGHTWGTHVALGLAVHLNPFDQAASVNLDNSVGINHTYLFAEYMLMQLTGLGQSSALWVGSNTWAMGLTFEF